MQHWMLCGSWGDMPGALKLEPKRHKFNPRCECRVCNPLDVSVAPAAPDSYLWPSVEAFIEGIRDEVDREILRQFAIGGMR